MKPSSNGPLPAGLEWARNKWTWRGDERPPWADPTEAGQESVWDYPRPPSVVPSDRQVVVRAGEDIVAETTRAKRVLETASPPTFYIPIADVNMELLDKIPGASVCEWKGWARYWTLSSNPGDAVGWDYPEPFPEMTQIADHLSFYPSKLECTVGGEIVKPQPGRFYGGWLTSELVGPFKGEPGSGSW